MTHMHWTERLEAIGELYLRAAFGVESDRALPPVSIHQMCFIQMSPVLIDVQSTLPST